MDNFPPDVSSLEEIVSAIERSFGFRVHSAEAIERGWLNRKWKVSTDRGVLFAKQYHPDRYRLHEPDKLHAALTRQNRLHTAGFPCPRIYTVRDNPILATDSGVNFVLTDFSSGFLIEPGGANPMQMASLGETAGRMHTLLNDSKQADEERHWSPESPETMLQGWRKNWDNAQGKQCPDGLLESLELQREIIERIDLSLFADCPAGWTHWDLWVDNLLFQPDAVAAVLDFDRMRVLYPELDIARAILSCALDAQAQTLDLGLAKAFLEGYRREAAFPQGALARSFKLLWCLESLNWMVHDMDAYSAPPARFARENIWMTRHWHAFEDMFGGM